MSDVFRLGDVELTASFTATVDRETFECLAATPGQSVTIERRVYDPRPRCLWGCRRGYVQVGSPEDAPTVWRMTAHDARWSVDPDGTTTFEARGERA